MIVLKDMVSGLLDEPMDFGHIPLGVVHLELVELFHGHGLPVLVDSGLGTHLCPICN